MPEPKKKNRRKKLPMSPVQQDVVRRFLEFHREGFLAAYLKARDGMCAAPMQAQWRGMMDYRKHGMSAIDFMIDKITSSYEFMVALEDTYGKPPEA